MSLVPPLPPGTSHLFTEDGMEFLPAFVRARLQYLADIFDWHPDDEEEDPCDFTYHEVRGKLSDGYYRVGHSSLIQIWIGSSDNCNRSLYLGGPCWICPESHFLSFDAIDPTLLPPDSDPNVWWCINSEEDIKVIKIVVCPPEEITEDFPNGV